MPIVGITTNIMKEFNLTTNELLDYLIEKLVDGEEVYIDLITTDVATSYICLDEIEDKEQRRVEAHNLLDTLRDKPLYVFGKDIDHTQLFGDLYDLPIGDAREKTFVQIGNQGDGDFAQTFYPMEVIV